MLEVVSSGQSAKGIHTQFNNAFGALLSARHDLSNGVLSLHARVAAWHSPSTK